MCRSQAPDITVHKKQFSKTRLTPQGGLQWASADGSSEAKNSKEASELWKEDWLRADLIALTSNRVPLCTSTAKLKVGADEIET